MHDRLAQAILDDGVGAGRLAQAHLQGVVTHVRNFPPIQKQDTIGMGMSRSAPSHTSEAAKEPVL